LEKPKTNNPPKIYNTFNSKNAFEFELNNKEKIGEGMVGNNHINLEYKAKQQLMRGFK